MKMNEAAEVARESMGDKENLVWARRRLTVSSRSWNTGGGSDCCGGRRLID
jgi:hypothetical protein